MLALQLKLTCLALFLTRHVVGGDASNQYTCSKDALGDDHCHATSASDDDDDDDAGPIFLTHKPGVLTEWDPVEVGHRREVEVSDGRNVTMQTMAMEPPIFRIDDFLTDEESEHIVNEAKKTIMFNSELYIDKVNLNQSGRSHAAAKNDLRYFEKIDTNNDSLISTAELTRIAGKLYNLHMRDDDITTMIETLSMRELDDHVITREEFETQTRTGAIDAYFHDLHENHPRHRDRLSEQAWIGHRDPIMSKLRDKVVKLTGLPEYIVRGQELVQVLRYGEHGHYNAHYDSQDPSVKVNSECCHFSKEDMRPHCLICRFMTIVYYLNNVEEGGETAFPIADRDDYLLDANLREKYNLYEYCKNASVVVVPRRNTAVMWYNHAISDDGWLGDMDYQSLHGGCVVKKGEKWLANNWIVAPPSESRHKKSVWIER